MHFLKPPLDKGGIFCNRKTINASLVERNAAAFDFLTMYMLAITTSKLMNFSINNSHELTLLITLLLN